MKWSFLLLPVIFLIACESLETRKEKYPSGKLKAKYEVSVNKEVVKRNGVYEEYFENGQMKSILNYSDDREHGLYRSYFETGQIRAEIYFLEGKMNGDYREWYDTGRKKMYAEYKKGQFNGWVTTWDVEGNKVANAKFSKGECKKGDCNHFSSTATAGKGS